MPEYSDDRERAGEEPDGHGVQLGRRFRALKLWMVPRLLRRARVLPVLPAGAALRVGSTRIRTSNVSPGVQRRVLPLQAAGVSNEAALETLNQSILDAANASGEVFLSHTKLRGRCCCAGRLQYPNDRGARAAGLGTAASARGAPSDGEGAGLIAFARI